MPSPSRTYGSSLLSGIPRLKLPFLRWRFPSFQYMGAVGFLGAFLYGLPVAAELGLPWWTMPANLALGIASLFTTAHVVHWLRGREDMVYYQQMITYLLYMTILLLLTGWPFLAAMDLFVLTYGVFNIFGRVGCFLVGCCHGKPHAHGVTYSEAYRGSGFPIYLIGVPLFPIQLVESGLTALAVAAGTLPIFLGATPGTALLIYLLAYAGFRFVLEFFRGDIRPYAWGFSEAQWSGLAVAAVLAVLGGIGWLPLWEWSLATAVATVLSMLAYAGYRARLDAPVRMLQEVAAVRELVALAEQAAQTSEPVPRDGPAVNCTSWGLYLSAGQVLREGISYMHYSLSLAEAEMSMRLAKKIGQHLTRIRHNNAAFSIVEGKSGVYHVFVKNASPGAT